MSQKIFAHAGEEAWTPTPDGNRRRVLLHTNELMLVEFGFDKGGVGAPHSHPHVQSSYVAEGRFTAPIFSTDRKQCRPLRIGRDRLL